MRYLIGILVIILCFSHSSQAQKLWKESWKGGQITLKNGQKLSGELQYNLKENVVVLRAESQMRAFSAYSVQSFVVVDSVSGITQNFFSVSYGNSSELPREMFFQMVFDGSFTLFLRKREIASTGLHSSSYPVRPHPAKENRALVLNYYVFLPDGRFEEFESGKQRLGELLSLDREEIRQLGRYITSNNIDLTNQTDIIQLIHHYVSNEVVASRWLSSE